MRLEEILSSYKAVFYTTRRGDSPVKEFIESLDKKSRVKINAYIKLLQEAGPNLKRPYADQVRGKIRELRPGKHRVLYFFFLRDLIVLVHALKKKAFRLKRRDIDQAERNMADYITRYQKGEITL